MISLLMLSARNLMRYQRRTILTSLLIIFGVVALLLYVALASSFKHVMVSNITDSMLGHLQIHKKGYTGSIENLPLNLVLSVEERAAIEKILQQEQTVEAFSSRIKFGAMLSNFTETTNIRLNGINPKAEDATVPDLRARLTPAPTKDQLLVEPGKILLPILLAEGMSLSVGDTIVLIATNAEGSVNGRNFIVQGVLEAATGPGGRDGYIHEDDAKDLLRMETPQSMEIAVRLTDINGLSKTLSLLTTALQNTSISYAEIHPWTSLSPFATIAKMIDMMSFFIRIMMISVVLVSVLNVMLMAVYERIREIGTLAAIGTPPSRIMLLFMGEGLLLGLGGTLIGAVISLGIIGLLNMFPLTFNFAQQTITLFPRLSVAEIGWVMAVSILVSAFASLQPAWKAAHLDPISALRHV